MAERSRPRRPAMLEPGDAEQIQGDEDPAGRSEVAHTTAQAIVSRGRAEAMDDPELSERLVRLVDTEGLDAIAVLWSRSPASTLPGTLWRLYLLREWVRRDPETVARRYRSGLAHAEVHGAIAGVQGPPGPGEVSDVADQILHGLYKGDFGAALQRAASFLRVLATGSAIDADWIERDDDALADAVTRRGGALLATAEELEEAAKLHRQGKLD